MRCTAYARELPEGGVVRPRCWVHSTLCPIRSPSSCMRSATQHARCLVENDSHHTGHCPPMGKADEMLLPLLSASNGPVPFSLFLYLAAIYDYGTAQPDGRQIGFSSAIPIWSTGIRKSRLQLAEVIYLCTLLRYLIYTFQKRQTSAGTVTIWYIICNNNSASVSRIPSYLHIISRNRSDKSTRTLGCDTSPQ